MTSQALEERNAFISEPARSTPVWAECDVCVIGGSCTGVFAAVRAARMGMRVVLVERMGCFGGVATLSLVNVWHTCLDECFERQIFAGLTLEVIDRLKRRGTVTERERSPHWAWAFNPQELQIELDELVLQSGIRPYLHTLFVSTHAPEGRLEGIVVENKSGRGTLLARQFIDASGDGDVAARLGIETYTSPAPQPSTACAVFSGWSSLDGIDWKQLLGDHGAEFGIPHGFAWGCFIPGSDNFMLAATRVAGRDSTDGDELTLAEIEGRRQIGAILAMLKKYAPSAAPRLQALPARIGIRETRHVRCRYQLTGDDVLSGRRFGDAIASGSYRVDIHHRDGPGITLRYLDGRQEFGRPGHPLEKSRWRPVTPVNPAFYQIPFRSLVPAGGSNLLVAGRMIDADPVAHAAIRVMVNLNQTGEAAGVAAALAVQGGCDAAEVRPECLREALRSGGSLVI